MSYNVQVTCQLLESLGFVINSKKSQLVPSVICKYLGFVYNSRNMTTELPQYKKRKVKLQIKKVSKLKKCSIRELATFIGTSGACCSVLRYAWVHMKEFERDKFLDLKSSNGDCDAYISLSTRFNPDF